MRVLLHSVPTVSCYKQHFLNQHFYSSKPQSSMDKQHF